MSNMKRFGHRGVAMALGLAVLAMSPAAGAGGTDDAARSVGATPWGQVPHHHGPPNKRWIHRYAHPVPEPEVRRSIRPKQYGLPSVWARSWIRRDIQARSR